MNTPSLSRLYQRLVATRPPVDVDADALAAVAAGEPLDEERQARVAAVLASSPAHARLARMLQALKADSEALAAGVGAARAPRHAHPARGRAARVAVASPRRARAHLRWAGALAAGVAVAFGIGAWQHAHDPATAMVASVAPAPARPDRIFASNDRIFAASEDGVRHGPARDELFRSSFSPGRS
jgi:hypothetical protein